MVYDFNDLAENLTSDKYMSEIETRVPLSDLYEIESTACYSENNKLCPVILKVKDKKLQTLMDAKYLVQVWNRHKEMLYEVRLNEQVRREQMSLISNTFVLFVTKNNSVSEYEVVRFDECGDQVTTVLTVQIEQYGEQDEDEVGVAMLKDYFILARKDRLLYYNLVEIFEKAKSTPERYFKCNIKLRDFREISN